MARDPPAGVATRRRVERATREPGRRKVLLHNDDYTTQEFVVGILTTVFHRSPADAVRVMLEVHHQGVAVAGVYTAEIAEEKAARVQALARDQEFPLLATTEPA